MTRRDLERVRVLTERLDRLERETAPPATAAIRHIARDALIEEIARLTRGEWLDVQRRNGGLVAVSMSG